MPQTPALDLRQHSRQTRTSMVRIGLALIAGLGLLIVGVVYGWPAAGVGALCMAGALLAAGAVAGVLWLVRLIVVRAGYDD